MDHAPPPWLVRAEQLYSSLQTLKESAKLQAHIDSTKWIGRTSCVPKSYSQVKSPGTPAGASFETQPFPGR